MRTFSFFNYQFSHFPVAIGNEGSISNLYKCIISVNDLQMGEVSLRAVHLDKVALGLGHY